MKYKNQGHKVKSHQLSGVWINEPDIMFTEFVDASISKNESIFRHQFDDSSKPTTFFDICYVSDKLEITPERLTQAIFKDEIEVQLNFAQDKPPFITIHYRFIVDGRFAVFHVDELPNILPN
ncbi:hypothetical protein [Psychroflexus sp. MES1-P1E]|uniref:hypothetical protein n=1 Tax=Psychroflexus sp. MES1-P1E TaxID=2058320 RepID=UPI000C7A4672|nr:hypothetical protein [Psychroflexus sp. MES1-P1E]PKG43803.1 hypothetical protein CXF67_03075 [Psychroflexus sp. MES1-P1E]